MGFMGAIAAAASAAAAIKGMTDGPPDASGGGFGGGGGAFDAMDQHLDFSQNTPSPIQPGPTEQATDGIDRNASNPYAYGNSMKRANVTNTTDPSALLNQWKQSIG